MCASIQHPHVFTIPIYPSSVSVSSPKQWAISLYKTTLTRCAFLGIPTSDEDYNDVPNIASSVTTTPGVSNNVRRRSSMGEAGVLALGDEAVGWRAKRRADGDGSYLFGRSSNVPIAASGGCGGVGILQLLAPTQSKLVPILGKKTGWNVGLVNKRVECATLGNEWVSVVGRYVFCILCSFECKNDVPFRSVCTQCCTS